MSVLVPPAQLIGSDVEVPCADGHPRRYVNLDYAASTPVLAAVWDMVEAFVPWYSSVHRGTGAKSQVSTAAYEHARDVVAGFVGAEGSSVVFVRNTTEAINVLAHRAAAGHEGALDAGRAPRQHAPLAPARPAHAAVHDLGRRAARRVAERALQRRRIDLLAVTGASNVTGEVWPLQELAALAHAHGAQLFVDAAQLAPHRAIDMTARGDRPPRALRPQALRAVRRGRARQPRAADGEPLLHGGGAIKLVTLDDVVWADAPDRYEAGSPNVIGAVAFAAACEALKKLGMDAVADRERALSSAPARRGWRRSPA